MDIATLLSIAIKKDASDLHLTAGVPPVLRINGNIKAVPDQPTLTSETIQGLASGIITKHQKEKFETNMELDFSFEIDAVGRFRVNMFRQKGNVGMVFRIIPDKIPTPESIGLPDSVINLTNLQNGLVLVTGPTGSGKSTTLASLINKINSEQSKHILTVEDPIEFVYEHKYSIVNQRQVESDTTSFAGALKSALREDPDVILVGEMRDLETISATLTIAETGHLALATLHTVSVAQTVDRIVDVFPPHHQQQIRMLLSSVLRGVVCQLLLPNAEGTGRVAAREILITDHAIGNMIREGQTQQIYSRIQTGRNLGMCTLDTSIQELYEAGQITRETAEAYFVNNVKLQDFNK